MEALAVLEKKIAELVEVINALRVENGRLLEENRVLSEKIEHEDESSREAARVMIDNLIKNIDLVIAHEHTP